MTICKRPIAGILTGLFLLLAASAGSGGEWRGAEPGFHWDFPRDHWAHEGYRTEWWYVTGHLRAKDDPARRFGFQFTFFRVGLLAGADSLPSSWATTDLVMGHASVGNVAEEEHRFSDVLVRAAGPLGGFGAYPDSLIAWCLPPAGTDGRWELRWNGRAFDLAARDDRRGFAFDLTTTPGKPPVFQGPEGYSRKGRDSDAASLYYSFTRLGTEGTLVWDGDTLAVDGTAWMDKEFGSNQLTENQVGWDWFSLQLRDGRDVMLYVLRDREGNVEYGKGTVISPEGEARYLSTGGWSREAEGTWRSAETGAVYPSSWIVRVPSEDLDMRVRPLFAEQENVAERSGGLFYWEGAVEVTAPDGSILGEGYVELTGYGEGNRPPI